MSVSLHTNLGDIKIEVFCDTAQRTSFNFLALCASGYYNGTLFHRNIKGFAIQGGDPSGMGKGGESIWGGKFEDEFHTDNTHDKRGQVSMANTGTNSNGSQFFITYERQPHLNNVYTVFGRVLDGWDVLDQMERLPVEGEAAKKKRNKSRPINPPGKSESSMHPVMRISAAVLLATASICVIFPCIESFAPIIGQRITNQHVKQPLHGIMDEVNSDAFDLSDLLKNDDDEPSTSDMEKAYEMFLGQLVFSANDPRIDIMDNYELCADPKWLTWLDNKINRTTDVEEKMALKDLNDMIVDVVKRVDLSKAAEDRAAQEAEELEKKRISAAEAEMEKGKALSGTDVLKKAAAVDSAGIDAMVAENDDGSTKKTFYEKELTPEIRSSYEDMCSKVLPPYKAGDTPASIVFNYYDQFDAQFIKVLNERAMNGDDDSQAVLNALAVEQQKRVNMATENLRDVLSKGEPMRMQGAIVKLAKEGKIDEPFLLLLEANADQARAAGATGPAELMDKLRERAMTEKDKQSASKEIKLLRQLLREPDQVKREDLLTEAFTPKEALIVPGTAANMAKADDEFAEADSEEKPMPDVPPPDFINCCKAVLLNFGNLEIDEERGDLSVQIKQIASEAEVVATRIYGKGMSAREQQDRAWKEQTTSIFDLETLEIEAERRGETAPWANPDGGDEMFPGFDPDGKMKIGGS